MVISSLKQNKRKLKVKEIKVKVRKTRNELKVSDSKTYPLKNEDERRTDEER